MLDLYEIATVRETEILPIQHTTVIYSAVMDAIATREGIDSGIIHQITPYSLNFRSRSTSSYDLTTPIASHIA